MLRSTIFASLAALSLIACTDVTPTGDELADETASDGEAGKGDSADAFTFFTVTPDGAAQQQGATGFRAARANRTSTLCGRGNTQAECSITSIDWTATAMPASVASGYESRLRTGEPILVKGSVQPGADDRGTTLAVSEVWLPATSGVADGVFVLVKDNGKRCVTAPCPDLTEFRVNSNRSADIHEIDLAATGADEATLDRATEALYGDGVIIAGDRYYGDHSLKGRRATQFFLKAAVPAN